MCRNEAFFPSTYYRRDSPISKVMNAAEIARNALPRQCLVKMRHYELPRRLSLNPKECYLLMIVRRRHAGEIGALGYRS